MVIYPCRYSSGSLEMDILSSSKGNKETLPAKTQNEMFIEIQDNPLLQIIERLETIFEKFSYKQRLFKTID